MTRLCKKITPLPEFDEIVDHAKQAAKTWESLLNNPDPLHVVVRLSLIDGEGGTLASSAPFDWARHDKVAPTKARLRIDIADWLSQRAGYQFTIRHEFAHCLGFGIKRTDLTSKTSRAAYCYNLLSVIPKPADILDKMKKYMPGGEKYLHPPLSSTGHWNEKKFNKELMTPYSDGEDRVLSVLTLAALADVFNVVNWDESAKPAHAVEFTIAGLQ